MHNRIWAVALLSMSVLGCGAANDPATDVTADYEAMVVTANPHATDAGVRILREGGSAVDAAIAIQTVLSLTEPQSSGIGGGAFLIHFDQSTGDVVFYDGREEAPSGAGEDLFLGEDGTPLRYIDAIKSGRSTGVPGVMAMLHMAHSDHGQLDWAASFEDGIRLAEDGFEISPRLAGLIARAQNFGFGDDPMVAALFFDESGQPRPAGDVMVNMEYAQTLRAVAGDWRAMYEGDIPAAIIDTVTRAPRPGTLSIEDFAAYAPRKRGALCSPYRERTICGPQMPSSGGLAVQSILGTLENFDMADYSNADLEGWHLFIEASRLGYADRDKFAADDRFVDVPVTELLDDDYLAARAGLISKDGVIESAVAGNPTGFARGEDATGEVPGTSHFVVRDKWGDVVSMTTTVESVFGSQRMAGGFMLNNQLTDFSFRAVDDAGLPIANAPEAGKRPRSSMSPTIVFDEDGNFELATGSPGGNSIIAYTARSLVMMLDWDMAPADVVGAPNIVARGDVVRVEKDAASADFIAGLEALGHEVDDSRGENSGLHIIRVMKDGGLQGAADPRREGTVGTP